MKVLVTSTTIPISPKPGSYRSAEALMYADMLQNEGHDVTVNYANAHNVHDFDILALYNGMEANDKMINIYGGEKNDKVMSHLEHWSTFKKEVISLDKELPNYGKILRYKLEDKEIKNTIDFDNLREIHERTKKFRTSFTEHCVIGDSHAVALYRPKWNVANIAYCTLNGFLQKDIFHNHFNSTNIKEVEFFLGNIDVRHHLCRIAPDYIQTAQDLAKRYIEYVEKIDVAVKSIYVPLPIENESRVVPKTGWYDGKPFWGTQAERNDARKAFIDTLNRYVSSNVKIVDPWNYLLNKKGELDFENMERPRSVHLSRNAFLYWKGEQFNVEKPVKNTEIISPSKSLI